ncbi:MAG: hypothetical protein Q8942_03850 [Bacillota bacterium]|nr:hypothetical protein [Bacillota bacterium]
MEYGKTPLGKKYKKNSGSAMIMVMLMIIIMSLLGISLVASTMGGLNMSIFHSDYNRAFYTSESAVEQAANVINAKVANIQEEARASASDYIQDLLQYDPNKIRISDGKIKDDSIENEFKTKYMDIFYQGLQNEFGSIDKAYLKTLLNTTTTDSEGQVYKDLGPEHGIMILESAEYDNVNHYIKLRTKGVYNDYNKRLEVTFNLLPNPSKTPYQGVQKVSVNKSKQIPDIFNKALVSEKNIIAASGNINIKGDVLCFGTVPKDESGEEDQSATWNRYGGIIAGMSADVTQYENELGFDSAKTGSVSKGSITIDGSAATMAYIHSVYGDDVASSSNISITGDIFARSVRSEEKANYSQINLGGNAYISDNLQIDSNESQVNVDGIYYGFVDAGYMIDGSGSDGSGYNGLLDSTQYKRTSSITVNGDSILNINNKLYLGGSTFFKKVLDTNGNPFMTGISALKSGKKIGNAFLANDEETGDPNPLYWNEDGAYSIETPYFSTYNVSGTDAQLMAGKLKNGIKYPFTPTTKGLHFKGIWDNLWKTDIDVRSSYIDTQSINITGNGINGSNIAGYSNGAVIANGQVYGSYDFDEGPSPVLFHAVQNQCLLNYYNAVKDFLAEGFSLSAPKLDYVSPTRRLDNYLGDLNKYTGARKIVGNEPYVISDGDGNIKGMFYYGDKDTYISSDGSNFIIDGNETIPKGIMYVNGNVYLDDNVTFNGVIIATGNIIFLGDSNITYNPTVIHELFNNDVNLNGFFNLLEYEVPDEIVKSQRTDKQNISVISWTEVE